MHREKCLFWQHQNATLGVFRDVRESCANNGIWVSGTHVKLKLVNLRRNKQKKKQRWLYVFKGKEFSIVSTCLKLIQKNIFNEDIIYNNFPIQNEELKYTSLSVSLYIIYICMYTHTEYK